MTTLIAIAALVQVQAQRCEITTYGPRYRNTRSRTASGAKYDYRAMTCAVSRDGRRPRVPFGTRVSITYKGRSVTVTVTDTGSHRARGAPIWFDLSDAAMAALLAKPLNPPSAYQTRFIGTWQVVQ